MAAPSPLPSAYSSAHHHFFSPPSHDPFLSHTLQLIDELWFCGNVLRWPGRRGQLQGGAMKIAGVVDGSEMSVRVVLAGGGGSVCEDESGVSAEFEQVKAREELHDPRMKLKGEEKEYSEQVGEIVKIEVKTEICVDQPVGMHQQKQKSVELKENDHELEFGLATQKRSHQFVAARKFQLETINSGKLLVTEVKTSIPLKRRERRGWRKRNKSLTDLEYDELKGIRDLGFNFSEDELTPRMISLVPGLKSYNKQSTESTSLQAEATRLYPSADWWISKTESPLQSWQIPYPQREGIDMKEQLKFWARAVASTVRQEC